ncbi:MAG: hypothetical protein ABII74_06405 [Elusimicrobiota bacterium]
MRKKMIFAGSFAVLVGVIVFYLAPTKQTGSLFWGVDKQKAIINSLLEKGLYKQAGKEYEKLAESAGLSLDQRANLYYLAANLYFDDLRDYEAALVGYLKSKTLAANSEVSEEINRRSVECLERLGHSLDAQQEMDKLTLLNKKPAVAGGIVIAKIGKKEITWDELERRIKDLPPEVQKYYKNKEKMLEFLKNYIVAELLYDTAKRKNFDRDPEIVEKAFQSKKNLMVQKLLGEEVKSKVQVTDSEIQLYYQANKDKFSEKGKLKPITEVKESIQRSLEEEKAQQVYQDLIEKMLVAEKVTIYEDLLNAK